MLDKKVIVYASRQLKFHEKNYSTHDLNILIFACFKFQHSEASRKGNSHEITCFFRFFNWGMLWFIAIRFWLVAFIRCEKKKMFDWSSYIMFDWYLLVWQCWDNWVENTVRYIKRFKEYILRRLKNMFYIASTPIICGEYS